MCGSVCLVGCWLAWQADLTHFNTSHTVHHLSFGEAFDQQVNPLSKVERILEPEVGPSGVYQYYICLLYTSPSPRDRG